MVVRVVRGIWGKGSWKKLEMEKGGIEEGENNAGVRSELNS